MRWQQLFADLQAQFEEEEAAAERAESASRTRAEVGAVRLADRLRGRARVARWSSAAGARVRCRRPGDVGADWLLLEDEGARRPSSRWRRCGRSAGSGGGPPPPSRPAPCAAGWTCAGPCAVWRGTGPPSRSSSTTAAC